MKRLHISKTLSLPADAVTSTIVIYGGKGMGKTNLASVLVEEFAGADLRFAVIDPMGVWWGLRHGADGKSQGIRVLILGGTHADLPITPESGALVADLVVDEDANVIIDISRRADGSMWFIAERIRFVRDYAKRIYQRQGEKRRPINQVIDEAARFAPQIVRQGESEVAACMGAIAVLVEEGRNVGIGVTLVTQRSARLNKDVAELADCMIAFRIVGPNSMRAVLDWLGEHVEKSRLKDIGEKLRSLPRGSALVVSPGWLEFEGIVAMRMRATFDSSATPKAGIEPRASGAGARLDIAKYEAKFAGLIEQAKANDPKALKARVVDLERQLAAKPGAAKTETKVVEVKVPVLTEAEIKRLETVAASFEAVAGTLYDELENVGMVVKDIEAAIHLSKQLPPRPLPVPMIARSIVHRDIKPANMPPVANGAPRSDASAKLPPGERTTLAALIQYPNGLRREQLTILTGYKRSTRDAYIARLREKGFVDTNLELVVATAAGRAALPDAEPLPSGEALQEYWLARLPVGERAVLEVLLGVHPEAIERTSIDESTGFKRSTRDAYLSRLAAKELVSDAGRGTVRASAQLFEVR